jgi:hypothetical protein
MPLRVSRFIAAGLLLLTSGCGLAADASPRQMKATPDTVRDVLARAADGDTVVLGPGVYKDIAIRGRTFKTPLTIDATAATIVGLSVKNGGGLVFKGGEFRVPPPVTKPSTGQLVYGHATRFDNATDISFKASRFRGPGAPAGDTTGPFGEGYGVFVVGASNVAVADSRFEGLKVGIALTRVNGFKITGNEISAMRADGIAAGESRDGLIEKNRCLMFRVRDKEHPDCIQMWSRPTSPPVSDVVIRGNVAEGNMQGIGLFNHQRDGVDDGGFDRIVIEDNDMKVGYPQGIALMGARDSVVRNNRVSTFKGAKWKARISIGQTERCGNTIEAGAGHREEKDRVCQN